MTAPYTSSFLISSSPAGRIRTEGMWREEPTREWRRKGGSGGLLPFPSPPRLSFLSLRFFLSILVHRFRPVRYDGGPGGEGGRKETEDGAEWMTVTRRFFPCLGPLVRSPFSPLTALLAPFPYARRAPYGVSTPYTPSALRVPATRCRWVRRD